MIGYDVKFGACIMGYESVEVGQNAPSIVNVIIEIGACQAPVKYELDKDSGTLHVDRFLSTSMQYPCNYGYVPNTLCDDGDPADVLVITPHALQPGVVIESRLIGALDMTDEKGGDYKLLAVPSAQLTSLYDHVQQPMDLPEGLLAQIQHFFEHYKDLEPNKWVKIDGWLSAEEAIKRLSESII